MLALPWRRARPDKLRFACVLVGGTTLPIRCAELLLDRGHRLAAIVTDDHEVAGWAAGHEIERIKPDDDVAGRLHGRRFDYLFSVNNLRMLPTELLDLAQEGAINFHDGPLPRLAGMNVPAWAILRGETGFGVTWHLMTAEADAGDLVAAQPLEIEPGETTLTLNIKCYEAAVDSFERLLGDIERGELVRRPQRFEERTFFGRHDRPVAAAVLRWDRPAAELDALVRALEFGGYANPLGLPKVILAEGPVVVRRAALTGVPSPQPPGTVLAVRDDALLVATATEALELGDLESLGGDPIPLVDLAARGVHVGTTLPLLGPDEQRQLDELQHLIAPHEDYWARRLATLEPLTPPQARSSVTVRAALENRSIELDESTVGLLAKQAGLAPADAVLAAVGLYLSRVANKNAFDVAYADETLARATAAGQGLVAAGLPLRVDVDADAPFSDSAAAFAEQLAVVRSRTTFPTDLALRNGASDAPVAMPVALIQGAAPLLEAQLAVAVSADGRRCTWSWRPGVLAETAVVGMQEQLCRLLEGAARAPTQPVGSLPLLSADEEWRLLHEWNDTAADYPREACVHDLIEEQVRRTPDETAVVVGGRSVSYRELDARAERLAAELRTLGAAPDVRIGLCVERSVELIVGLLGILKAGAAYVPMDPGYPPDRIAFMIEDARSPVIVATEETAHLLPAHSKTVLLRQDEEPRASAPVGDTRGVTAENLAYVIFTSGSTGKPKGVMVTHRNVVNFFHGMDELIEHDPPGVWLACTSISFDISVLELLWTLTRGFRVVVYQGEEAERLPRSSRQLAPAPAQQLDFGLFYFGSSAGGKVGGEETYRMLLEGARFADERGFDSIWTPERHFHAFGGLFPNPALTGAAIAVVTRRIGIRAGSVVGPLHDAVRIAEEWSVVDNLSGGRVGVSFASGWQPDDFVLARDPAEAFPRRKELMMEQIELVQRLWHGEEVPFQGPFEEKKLAVLPRPIQPTLPIWLTAAGSPDTFELAGTNGFNVLTHLLGQSIEEVAEKIAIYREARRAAGHDPHAGAVTVMLHSFVGASDDEVREAVRAPMKAYLRSSVGLIKRAAWTFPTFRQATTGDNGDFTLDNLSEEELEAVLEFSFERYFETSGLLGSHDKCVGLLEELRKLDIDEIACLIDFVDDVDLVLGHLPALDEVRRASKGTGDRVSRLHTAPRRQPQLHPVAALIQQHAVTHLQCTPSMASLLVATPGADQALSSLHQLLVGGEAFPSALAGHLVRTVRGSVDNMYGPTETTIWSSAYHLNDGADLGQNGAVPIGKPIANTHLYVLDERLQPVPPGMIGELWIGGDGVTRGYLDRSELTEDRFRQDPFVETPGARIYRTGDLARYRADGVLDFLGRTDDQIKLRGYRVELGEIEGVLTTHPDVREAAVVVRQEGGREDRLVAYLVPREVPVPVDELRAYLGARLPDFMIPALFETLDDLPRTPNKKIDRNALPDPEGTREKSGTYVTPRDDLERRLTRLWERVLRVAPIGVNDNFFHIGGHSLLAVRLFAQIEKAFGRSLPLATLFHAPTIAELAEVLREEELAPAWTALVEIQPEGSRPPFFCVHAHGGHVLRYYDLARRLGPDQPLYGLQAIGLDGAQPPYETFEEMASHYIAELRSVQPDGPYRLGGDCLGGVVAYEMARQLHEAGAEVSLLAMFDTYCPDFLKMSSVLPPRAYAVAHASRLAGFHLRQLMRLPARQKPAYAIDKLRRVWLKASALLRRVAGRQDALARTQQALDSALARYTPRPYDGGITLLRAEQLPIGVRDRKDLGWGGYVARVDVRELPTYFTTSIVEPGIDHLAEELRAALDKVASRVPTAPGVSAGDSNAQRGDGEPPAGALRRDRGDVPAPRTEASSLPGRPGTRDLIPVEDGHGAPARNADVDRLQPPP
jgi:natural product biosynthesis luciferase-like monooxygenase protein